MTLRPAVFTVAVWRVVLGAIGFLQLQITISKITGGHTRTRYNMDLWYTL